MSAMPQSSILRSTACLRVISILLIAVFLNFIQGCMFYYKVNAVDDPTPEAVRWEDFNKKYMILHTPRSVWHMGDIKVDTNMLTCQLIPLPDNHKMYLTTNPDKANRFIKHKKKKYEGDVLNEVHLYSKDTLKIQDDRAIVGFNSLEKMEIYYYAKAPTATSWIMGTVGVAAVIMGATTLIIALTKSSCPYVYTWKDGNYQFAGEIYSGANLTCLERNDYLPLPGFQPDHGIYRIKIANELPEIQYINLSELWAIHHPEQVTVLADKQGNLSTLGLLQTPVSAISSGMADQSALLNAKDQNFWQFDEEPVVTGDTCARNSLVITFNVPEDADIGKLVLRAKNSFWGDYVCGEFTRMFGERYSTWVSKQGKTPAEQVISNRQDQNLFLMVYLETADGWQMVDYFHMAGPLGFRDMVMPVPLEKAKKIGTDYGQQIRIRLETGFMFWELDYAAIDFTEDIPVKVEKVTASSALNEQGKNVGRLLGQDDRRYYKQPSPGDHVILDFASPPDQPGKATSVLLHTKGYYEHVRNYTDQPDREKLEAFRLPGRMSQYSYELFIKTKTEYSARNSSSSSK